MTRTAAAFAALLACSTASAREVYGVQVPETIEAGGATLRLNGAGVREAHMGPSGVTGVYVGALYLAAPASDPAVILAADQPWVKRMYFVRFTEQRAIMGGIRMGFENNSKEKLAQLAPKLDRLTAAIPDVRAGQVLVFAYQPGAGATVGVEGGAQVTVEGKDFADALLRNDLGPKPSDPVLKKAMLGGK